MLQTGVQVDQYSLGNSEEHWESAGSFLPERWFDSNTRKNEKASRPFLIGPRQCPGRNMALQFLQMAVGKTVYLYQMELINKDFDIAQHSSSCLTWSNISLDVSMKPRVPGVLGYEGFRPA
jgi:cytochrome P450